MPRAPCPLTARSERPHHQGQLAPVEFDAMADADACGVALRELWSSREAAPALVGAPRVRIVETVEDHEY